MYLLIPKPIHLARTLKKRVISTMEFQVTNQKGKARCFFWPEFHILSEFLKNFNVCIILTEKVENAKINISAIYLIFFCFEGTLIVLSDFSSWNFAEIRILQEVQQEFYQNSGLAKRNWKVSVKKCSLISFFSLVWIIHLMGLLNLKLYN